ncbi:putative photosynthetic NDH subunit of subcomplex B 5, chloroplastic protein [Dioscorea sansibarensis]
MATTTTFPLPLLTSKIQRSSSKISIPNRDAINLGFITCRTSLRKHSSTKLNGQLTEIEPDLEEDGHEWWRTNGVSPEDFKYGEYDGGWEGFWEALEKEYESAEPPTGFPRANLVMFSSSDNSRSYLQRPGMKIIYGEYLYIGAGIFVVIFCGIEMGKPDKPHNFEPEIYNMERSARDKLIADYNTMDIWDFNEKYGHLWDFTVKRDRPFS